MAARNRLRAFWRFATASARRAASLPADVVFATSTPLTIAVPAIVASVWRRRPMVFEVRDLWPDVPVALGALRNPVAIRAAYWLERYAYRSARRIVALAPGMKASVVERGIAESVVSVIPNGCDFDLFDGECVAAQEPPWVNSGSVKILYTGTMGLVNGMEYIPRLARALEGQADAPRVDFYLIGDGRQRAATEALAMQLGVLDRSVHFIQPMPKRDLARWLAFADATIMSHYGPEIVFRDSVANKFFDSIAAGKPVIANYSGFATLTAVQAGAGFIIDSEPARGAAQLAELVRDRTNLARAGERARVLASERFSRDKLARDLELVLLDAVNDRGARRSA
jgi:glycosyltransferase involved in cell wall biosynthesis